MKNVACVIAKIAPTLKYLDCSFSSGDTKITIQTNFFPNPHTVMVSKLVTQEQVAIV